MRQHREFKQAHPDCLLMFRMGDFYEFFFDDAETAHKVLGLTLTRRSDGVPLAGVPHHQRERYLRQLSAQGFRVAVADQIQDPKDAKGVVDRAVTQVVTPGTLVDEALLDGEVTNRLAAAAFLESGETSAAALAVVDASTGEFVLIDAPADRLVDELASRSVSELLYCETADDRVPPRVERLARALDIAATPRPAWHFRHAESAEAVLGQFGVTTTAGFGIDDDDPAITAAGVVIRYLAETQAAGGRSLAHLRAPTREPGTDRCVIDAVSLRALEIEKTIRSGDSEGSLLGLFLGRSATPCQTPMGRRLVREWLCRPSRSLATIRERHGAVAALVSDRALASEIASALEPVSDIARIGGRLALDRAGPRDLVALARSVRAAGGLPGVMASTPALENLGARIARGAGACATSAGSVLNICVDDPPSHLRDGGLIRDGVDAALDEARGLQTNAAGWLAEYQTRITAQLDLPDKNAKIKVGYNKVFGYYIELTAVQARDAESRIAACEMTRKQTLKNAERYITPELKDFEEKITTAQDRAVARELELFADLCASAKSTINELSGLSESIAELDVFGAFAARATRASWTRPEMVEERTLTIRDGRHPVLEESLGTEFVPNDLELGESHPRFALLTGPNMAGKSTFIRQTALITALAHAGSFVPAAGATIGVTDRIFTRVGSDDALHQGHSTFMVEMIETANILNNATDSSVVILDEIGRGTSTLDGLSLAWAITERLVGETGSPGPRTLFATHYHELTDLEDRTGSGVRNLHVSVRETPGAVGSEGIVFLHRVLPGRCDKSYGVQVARLAGVPESVTKRASQVLESLAVQHTTDGVPESSTAPTGPDPQMRLFTAYAPHPAVDRLKEIKLDDVTPLQAFDLLRTLCDVVSNPPEDT